jgi:hypothetical protein
MKLDIKRSWLIFTFILLTVLTGLAQVQQPERYEVVLENFDEFFEVISAEEEGVIIFRETREKSREGRQWEIIRLDTTLTEIWKKNQYFKFEYHFVGYAHSAGKFHMLFKDGKTYGKHLQLFVFDLNSEHFHQYTIENLFEIDLTHFEVTSQAAILGGYYNLKPVVIHFDLSEQKAKVLPAVYNNRTELIQIKINKDDTYNIVVSGRTFDKKLTLAMKTYSPDGEIQKDIALEPEGDKNIIFGRSAESAKSNQLLAGTYSNRRSDYSRGLFIANLNQEEEQNINYYNYADLKNFFNYMKIKREKRVRERITRKKISGKKLKFNYRLLVHDIIQLDDSFIMLGEAFYPKYSSTQRLDSWDIGGNEPNYFNRYGNIYLEGFRYTHAVVIGFDNNGKLLWDNSFEITDVTSYSLEQYVNVSVKDERIVLFYVHDNVIRTKIIKGSEVLDGKSFDNIRLSFEDDAINSKTAELNGLEEWYDDKFFAYGVQRIKNLKDTGVKLNRKVFYINKIVYQ